MGHADTKADRLLKIEALLLAHPAGLTAAELGRKLGVHRGTVGRYLDSLPKHIYIDDSDEDRWKIDRDGYLVNVRFTLHEALSLHLAARLMATSTDKQNPHAAAALRKLGIALEKLAPLISAHLKDSADVMDDAARYHDPVYLDALETLTRAWSLGRKVHLKHQLPDQSITEYTFAPYFVEPYAVGQSTHTIGWREPPGGLRTFKVERIRAVKLLEDSYTIPAEFDARALLADAWGIWYTEQTPVTVRLRFHPNVAARVQETRWHRSAVTTPQPDGYLLWEAQIAEPREMLPWIRGWGGDVEVLEPERVREAVVKEVRRMEKVYGIQATTQDPKMTYLLQCWGKTGKRPEQFHPAFFHLLDVGYVARALLKSPASPRWRRVLAQVLGADADTLHEWLPYFVALHDMGKFSAVFQATREAQRTRLEALGFSFGSLDDHHHTALGRAILNDPQGDLASLALPDTLREILLEVIGGHHGRFLGNDPAKSAQHYLNTYEPAEWRDVRGLALATLKQHLLVKPPTTWPMPDNVSAAIMALTGFTILCDWVGSDGGHFRPRPDTELTEYVAESQRCAYAAAQDAGFFAASTSLAARQFRDLFPDKRPPRPLQSAIDDIPATLLTGPCLAILEAPTGEGKTEAALALAHRLAEAHGTDELYYALPTTATSDQMFIRLQTHLRDRLELETQIRLIHGQAFLVEDDLRLEPMEDAATDHQEAALEWFSPKKRALLAPFGVGTIDQVELATLNVKHTALRMIGLAGKVIILDEVHAYDTYMTTIIEELLQWLRALDTSVILLSATLPQTRREKLARAYGVEFAQGEAAQGYPALWVFGNAAPHHAAPPAIQPNRTLTLEFLHLGDTEAEIKAKAQFLLDAVADGGCVGWMTNTVRRAQEIFAIVDQQAGLGIDRMLLHAQLPLFERKRREKTLRDKYGPPDGKTQRPKRGIVVGTQVLEQSLDLDFDLLVSDLAPIDLLLQRAGRLHRHARPERSGVPYFYVNAPLTTEGHPALYPDSRIYAAFLLLQTWATLEGRTAIVLPHDYRVLVEAVYGMAKLPADHPFQEEWKKLDRKEKDAIGEARLRLLPEPDPEWAFSTRMSRLQFEESENGAAWIIGKTRLGEESVTVIPLERRDDMAWGWPDGQAVALNQAASREVQLDLLRRQLRISNPDAVVALKAQALPVLFKRSTLLKEYFPLWLAEGRGQLTLPNSLLEVCLDKKLGLQIHKKGV